MLRPGNIFIGMFDSSIEGSASANESAPRADLGLDFRIAAAEVSPVCRSSRRGSARRDARDDTPDAPRATATHRVDRRARRPADRRLRALRVGLAPRDGRPKQTAPRTMASALRAARPSRRLGAAQSRPLG